MDRIKSNFSVMLLDMKRLKDEITAFAGDKLEKGEELYCSVDWGIVEVAGSHYLICNEGVGSTLSIEEEDGKIDWHVRKPNSIELMPRFRTSVTPDDFPSICTSEILPLDEFIRSFGTRLESNYWEWECFFKGVNNGELF